MKRRAYILAATLLTMIAASAAPSVTAGSCSGGSSGFGDESSACIFGCVTNEWINAWASVDDSGSVSASGNCGGVSASCSESDGYCYDWSNSPSTFGGNGGCDGFGNGGWWTDMTFGCYTQTAGSASPFATVDDVVADILADPTAVPEITGVIVTGHLGIFSGLSCVKGEVCVPFVPNCSIDALGFWSCEVR